MANGDQVDPRDPPAAREPNSAPSGDGPKRSHPASPLVSGSRGSSLGYLRGAALGLPTLLLPLQSYLPRELLQFAALWTWFVVLVALFYLPFFGRWNELIGMSLDLAATVTIAMLSQLRYAF